MVRSSCRTVLIAVAGSLALAAFTAAPALASGLPEFVPAEPGKFPIALSYPNNGGNVSFL